VAEYLYDTAGQKGLLDKSLAYDSAGTTVQVESDPVTYDNRNRLTQQRWVVAGTGGGTFRMDYAYNEADQRTSLTYPGDNAGAQGEAVSYTYNSVGQLTGASGSGVSYIASATYNAQGQLTQMVNDVTPNGLTRQWSYETNTLRLSILQAGKNAAFDDRQKLTYGYDNNGNVTSLTDTINAGQKQCFQYDWLNRLTAGFSGNSGCTAYSAIGTGAYNMSYGYDAIGNMTTKDGTPMTYGDAAHKHAVTAAFGNSYSYDGNGNQTSRNIGGTVSTFTYDYENRLTAISGGAMASFVYDADGNRVKSTVGSVITVYIAGVFEFIEAGTTDKITKYYEGNALRRSGYGVDDGVFYTLRDHLNSSSVIMNQAGMVVTNGNQYYLPYGGNRGSSFSSVTTKRFTGQYHENGLTQSEGLSYYNARWYDAKLGRFLSADTVVPGPTNPQAFNRYSYVFNNPLRFTDPTGHEPVDFCNGNRLCLAAFFLLHSDNMNNQNGLQANWVSLRDDVWYGEQRPTDLGMWVKDKEYPDMDHVYIYRQDYIEDIKSRPAFHSASNQFMANVESTYRGKLPEVGHTVFSYQRFTFEDSAKADRYNAVEWYLGSHRYEFTVLSTNNAQRTMQVKFEVSNISGWESALRWPGGFSSVLGTSILVNKGGPETQGAWTHYPMVAFTSYGRMWARYGETYRQTFIGNITLQLPFSEPIRGPR
jgi:RHS repeat-associated protein